MQVKVSDSSPSTSDTVKVSSLYDFWGLVHRDGFPSAIEFGKLDSYGTTTLQLVMDIVERDIDSRLMIIPKTFSISNISFDEDELGKDQSAMMYDFLDKYMTFRVTKLNLAKEAKKLEPK